MARTYYWPPRWLPRHLGGLPCHSTTLMTRTWFVAACCHPSPCDETSLVDTLPPTGLWSLTDRPHPYFAFPCAIWSSHRSYFLFCSPQSPAEAARLHSRQHHGYSWWTVFYPRVFLRWSGMNGFLSVFQVSRFAVVGSVKAAERRYPARVDNWNIFVWSVSAVSRHGTDRCTEPYPVPVIVIVCNSFRHCSQKYSSGLVASSMMPTQPPCCHTLQTSH